MSYAFDTLSRAWDRLKQTLPPEHRDGEIAMRFGFMLEELHDANHRMNDAINKDARVTADARRLESALAKPQAEQEATPPAKAQEISGMTLVGYQLSDGGGPDWHLRLFTKFAADEHVSAGGKVRALYAGSLPQDRKPLGPEDRRRIILDALSIGEAIDMVEATHGIFRAASNSGGAA